MTGGLEVERDEVVGNAYSCGSIRVRSGICSTGPAAIDTEVTVYCALIAN